MQKLSKLKEENKKLKIENDKLRLEVKLLQECCRSYLDALILEVDKRAVERYKILTDKKG